MKTYDANPQKLSLGQAEIALIGLRFEQKTNGRMRMTGKVNLKKLVTGALGLPNNKRHSYEVLIDGLEKAIAATKIEQIKLKMAEPA